MFLFIHGTLATQSLWLPQIRAILKLNSDYSDKELMNVFTLQLPGHPDNDKSFGYKEFKQAVSDFQKEHYADQLAIAEKLLLSGDRAIIQLLKNKKLILFGHSVGGALSLEYAIKNPANTQKLILTSTPSKFNILSINLVVICIKLLKLASPKSYTLLEKLLPFKRWRVASHLLAMNKDQKGFDSCIKYIKKFDFHSLHSVSSINQQQALSTIPTLLIGGKRDLIATSSSLTKLYSLLSSGPRIEKNQRTVIEGSISKSNVVSLILLNTGHNAMDESFDEFVEYTTDFLVKS